MHGQLANLRDALDNLLAVSNCAPQVNNCAQRLRNKIGPEHLASDGTYTVKVADSYGGGTYKIFIQRTNNPGQAEHLVSGDSWLVPLNACGEVDTYTFDAIENNTVYLDMTVETGSIVPRLELYGPDGLAVALPGTGSIDETLSSTGTFTALAFSAVDQVGTYRLDLTIAPGPQCQDADADGYGSPGDVSCPAGSQADCDDLSSYSFPGAVEVFDGSDNDCDGIADEGLDNDSDGIPDFNDSCPQTPVGTGVGWSGCPICFPDSDGDGFNVTSDCNDTDPLVYPDAPEINDCRDNQCPGDLGAGVADETSGNSGFHTPGDSTRYSWIPQVGATLYEVARGMGPNFDLNCTTITTGQSFIIDTEVPLASQAFFYLNRPVAPCVGSWGQDSTGQPRTVVCNLSE